MISFAFKMLIGNRAACIGVIFGIFLATLLISQQSAIFLGLVARSYRLVTDLPGPDIWVMDPATESEDKLRTIPLSYVDIVRSTENIAWAVPLSLSLIPVISPAGGFDICQLYGIDDATLIGGPIEMVEGSLRDIRRQSGVIVDHYSAQNALAKTQADGTKMPLQIGDSLEINGHYAVVVGICKVTQRFYPQPIIYTAFSHFKSFVPGSVNHVAFILAKARAGENAAEVCRILNTHPYLQALTRDQFETRVATFFLKTGILINFGLSVALGIIIGFSITGQIFYITTLENIMYYALIKAIGGTGKMILQMIIFQAALVGLIGFLLGTGATVLWGLAIQNTTLAFLFPWQLLVFTGSIVIIICVFTAALSGYKVFYADPKALMGN